MLNINLKIEAKKGYIIDNVFITFEDMPRSQELKMYYLVFEDCFLKDFLIPKESKRMKRNFDYKSSLTVKQNKLRLKVSKLGNSLIYIDKKIDYLRKPFPNQDTSNQIKLLESQSERINEIIKKFKDEIQNIFFGIKG